MLRCEPVDDSKRCGGTLCRSVHDPRGRVDGCQSDGRDKWPGARDRFLHVRERGHVVEIVVRFYDVDDDALCPVEAEVDAVHYSRNTTSGETNSDAAEVIVAAEQGPVLADDSLYNLGDEGGDSSQHVWSTVEGEIATEDPSEPIAANIAADPQHARATVRLQVVVGGDVEDARRRTRILAAHMSHVPLAPWNMRAHNSDLALALGAVGNETDRPRGAFVPDGALCNNDRCLRAWFCCERSSKEGGGARTAGRTFCWHLHGRLGGQQSQQQPFSCVSSQPPRSVPARIDGAHPWAISSPPLKRAQESMPLTTALESAGASMWLVLPVATGPASHKHSNASMPAETHALPGSQMQLVSAH